MPKIVAQIFSTDLLIILKQEGDLLVALCCTAVDRLFWFAV